MATSLRAVTTIDGNAVTLNVASTTASPPPPLRVAVSRRGTTITLKRGSLAIAIDLPTDAKKAATVTTKGRVVCKGSGVRTKMTDPPPPDQKSLKAKKRKTKGMTDPPPPDQK